MEIYCGNDKILSSIENEGSREVYTFYEKILPAQKVYKPQNLRQAAFFLLDGFMCTKILSFFICIWLWAFCAFYAKQVIFFLLDVFTYI